MSKRIVDFYKGDAVLRHRAQKRKGKKTGYIRVTLVGPPRRNIMVSFPDWNKHRTQQEAM